MAVKFDDILFVEVFNRIIIVHATNKDYEFYAKLADIENELSGYSFVRVSKSYIVNLGYVELLENNYAILKNGKILSISRRFKPTVDRAFVEFLIGR